MGKSTAFTDIDNTVADARSNVNSFAISHYARHKRDVEFAAAGFALEPDTGTSSFAKAEHVVAGLGGAVIWQAILDAGAAPATLTDGWERVCNHDAIDFLFGPDDRLTIYCRAVGDLKPAQVRAMLAVPPETSPLYEMHEGMRAAREALRLAAVDVATAQEDMDATDQLDGEACQRLQAGHHSVKKAYWRAENRIKTARRAAIAELRPILRRLQRRARHFNHM